MNVTGCKKISTTIASKTSWNVFSALARGGNNINNDKKAMNNEAMMNLSDKLVITELWRAILANILLVIIFCYRFTRKIFSIYCTLHRVTNLSNGVLACSCALRAWRALCALRARVLQKMACLARFIKWRSWRASKNDTFGVLHKMSCLACLKLTVDSAELKHVKRASTQARQLADSVKTIPYCPLISKNSTGNCCS